MPARSKETPILAEAQIFKSYFLVIPPPERRMLRGSVLVGLLAFSVAQAAEPISSGVSYYFKNLSPISYEHVSYERAGTVLCCSTLRLVLVREKAVSIHRERRNVCVCMPPAGLCDVMESLLINIQ